MINVNAGPGSLVVYVTPGGEPPDLNLRAARGTSSDGMDLSDAQRKALEAKVALYLDEYRRITSSSIAKVRQELAERGMDRGGAVITDAWAVIADAGRNVMQGLVNECLAIGWRDEVAITTYVTTHHAAFLGAFRVAEGSSAGDLAETLASSQARGEGASRIPNLVRAGVFEATKNDAARAAAAAPAVAAVTASSASAPAQGPARRTVGQWISGVDQHPARKLAGWVALAIGLGTAAWKLMSALGSP